VLLRIANDGGESITARDWPQSRSVVHSGALIWRWNTSELLFDVPATQREQLAELVGI
jgi:hypothetical protein